MDSGALAKDIIIAQHVCKGLSDTRAQTISGSRRCPAGLALGRDRCLTVPRGRRRCRAGAMDPHRGHSGPASQGSCRAEGGTTDMGAHPAPYPGWAGSRRPGTAALGGECSTGLAQRRYTGLAGNPHQGQGDTCCWVSPPPPRTPPDSRGLWSKIVLGYGMS